MSSNLFRGMWGVKKAGRRRFTALSVFVAVPVVAISLVGCSSSSSGSPSASAAPLIGISQYSLTSSLATATQNSLIAAAKAAGFRVLPPVNANADASKQIADLQSLVDRGAKALIVIPADPHALNNAIAKYVKQGIPVVTTIQAAEASDVYVNVQPDQVQMGTKQCEAAGKALDGKGTLYYQAGDVVSPLGAQRWKGFSDCMAKDFPRIEVTMKAAGQWVAAPAQAQMETAFSRQKFDALVLASDGVFITSAVTVLKSLNYLQPVGKDGHVYLSGIDGTAEGLDAIRQGWADDLVVQPVITSSAAVVQYVQDALDGKKLKLGPTKNGGDVARVDGVEYDFFPAAVANKHNVDDKSFWANTVN